MLAIHCGAGRHSRSEEKEREYMSVCQRACQEGMKILLAGGSSAHVVTAATKILEDAPVTNAGTGSALNLAGFVSCDASIMVAPPIIINNKKTISSEGEDDHLHSIMDKAKRSEEDNSHGEDNCEGRNYGPFFGAVGGVGGVKNPIEIAADLARRQEETPLLPLGRIPPLMLVGDGAREWAQNTMKMRFGSEWSSDPSFLVTEAAKAQHSIFMNRIRESSANQSALGDAEVFDTVGAVCFDLKGGLAAAVSSGGIPLKYPGRVGEVMQSLFDLFGFLLLVLIHKGTIQQAAIYGAGCWAQQRQQGGNTKMEEPIFGEGEDEEEAIEQRRTRGFACSATG